MRRAGLALALLAVSCTREAPLEPTVRFEGRSLGIDWNRVPQDPAERRRLADQEAAKGKRLLASGEELLGIAHLRRAVDLRPGSAARRRDLAAGFERIGDHDAALRLVREALRVRPDDPGALYDLGRIVYGARRARSPAELQEAVDAWRKLAASEPDTKEAANARRHLGDLERALAAARSDGGAAGPEVPTDRPTPASERVAPPSLGGAVSAADAILAGNELAERGRHAEAARAYARALELDGSDLTARRLLGLAHFRSGNYRAAIQAWERLPKPDPEIVRLLAEARRKAR